MSNSLLKRKPWLNWVLFFATLIVVFLLGLLASSITQRRAEKDYVYKPKVNLREYEPRNELWGKNYPREYQSYVKTKNTDFKSKYNGSAMIDELEQDPRMVVLWAGYGFLVFQFIFNMIWFFDVFIKIVFSYLFQTTIT